MKSLAQKKVWHRKKFGTMKSLAQEKVWHNEKFGTEKSLAQEKFGTEFGTMKKFGTKLRNS